MNHLKTAILHCEDEAERVIYARHMLHIYEEEGKRFLWLIS